MIGPTNFFTKGLLKIEMIDPIPNSLQDGTQIISCTSRAEVDVKILKNTKYLEGMGSNLLILYQRPVEITDNWLKVLYIN